MIAGYGMAYALSAAVDAAEVLASAPAPGAFAFLAAVAIGAVLGRLAVRACAARTPADGAVPCNGLAMLRRSERTGPVLLCDPGAPGRPRPRAPGAAPAAA
ncbi:hypothetical protein CLV63_103261 [Murinocardiopsis flavida]|uniref:Uncharacterized protein n=1 Tax=Murinocardiopsis flavida TaxID=645275 RepID=A0A2P8DQN8_9ACTN|nr:DUF6412 domain-containing protein [Murinocardiopsis flavida]PSK99536.1 hypothetical protein CLV63_103261 [Murinocardiopsis flavida]